MKYLTLLGLGTLLLILGSGCNSAQTKLQELTLSSDCANSAQTKLQELTLAPLFEMPDYVQQAASEVQEAYQFAVANPEALEHIPCYCGCNSMGHLNNTECYVKTFNPDGTVAEFENHAAY